MAFPWSTCRFASPNSLPSNALVALSPTLTSKMRITLILLIFPCFFNVLLASPLPGRSSLPSRERLHDISLVARAGNNLPNLPSKRFEGCDENQQIVLTKAEYYAVIYVKNALGYLKTYREDAPRYEHWFSKPDKGGWNSLKTLFEDILMHIRHGVYICEGEKYTDVGAYVKTKECGRVHICPPFWQMPLAGYRSQAGTIIHEWSHFDAIGGTEDHSESAGFWFAVLNPQKALNNAYSIQYFAENDPHRD